MSAASLKIRIPEHLPFCERRVLEKIANGWRGKSITFIGEKGKRITEGTVEYHRAKLQKRVDLYSQAELTKLAIRIGLTEIDV